MNKIAFILGVLSVLLIAGSRTQDYPVRNAHRYFNNVYKTLIQKHPMIMTNGVDTMTIPRSASATAYNYRDVGDSSLYLSAGHAYDSIGQQIKLVSIFGDTTHCEVIQLFRHDDVAILKGKADRICAPNTELIKSKKLILSEDCYIIGYPAGGYRCIKKSTISATVELEVPGCKKHNKLPSKLKLIVIDEITMPGYSGSPLFVIRDGKFKLAGMIVMYDRGAFTGLAIPIKYFKTQFKQHRTERFRNRRYMEKTYAIQ